MVTGGLCLRRAFIAAVLVVGQRQRTAIGSGSRAVRDGRVRTGAVRFGSRRRAFAQFGHETQIFLVDFGLIHLQIGS